MRKILNKQSELMEMTLLDFADKIVIESEKVLISDVNTEKRIEQIKVTKALTDELVEVLVNFRETLGENYCYEDDLVFCLIATLMLFWEAPYLLGSELAKILLKLRTIGNEETAQMGEALKKILGGMNFTTEDLNKLGKEEVINLLKKAKAKGNDEDNINGRGEELVEELFGTVH